MLPLARIIFCVCLGTFSDGGESARQRMAVLWLGNRKVSANWASFSLIVAVMPWRTLS